MCVLQVEQLSAENDTVEEMIEALESKAPSVTNEINGTNENGGSVLMSAAFHDNEKEVMRLLANGLEADHSNERGDTPLSVAAAKGNVGVMRLLVGHGAEAKPLFDVLDLMPLGTGVAIAVLLTYSRWQASASLESAPCIGAHSSRCS